MAHIFSRLERTLTGHHLVELISAAHWSVVVQPSCDDNADAERKLVGGSKDKGFAEKMEGSSGSGQK